MKDQNQAERETTPGELRRHIRMLESIIAIRDKELLEVKGPCSNKDCRLHYAHAGPCADRSPTGQDARSERDV